MDAGDLTCHQCEAPVPEGNRFCESCGARTERAATPPAPLAAHNPPSIGQQAAPATGEMSWEYSVPLINNRFMLWDFALLLIVSLALMQLLILAMGLVVNGEPIIIPLQMYGIIVAILIPLFVISVLIAYQNHFRQIYLVGPDGVTVLTGSRERRVNRVVTAAGVLALLAGRPGPLGASLIAQARETSNMRWRDVRRVTVHPGTRVIALSNSWRVVQRLYCTPENFSAVVEMVQRFAAGGTRWRANNPGTARRSNPLPYVGWSALAAVATVAATAWTEDYVGLVLTAGGLLLVAGLVEGGLRRVLAILGLVVTLIVGLRIAMEAMERTEFARGLIVVYGYEYQTGLLLISAAGTTILLLMSLLRLFGRRGGISGRARQPDSRDQPS